jgi:phosphoglycerol transferase MdoB-like AlkP superfamily enzyme
LSQTNKPFFASILSVSNHKPYTYPRGRIPENPNGTRDNVVKYTDWCLGQFFKAAKQEAFWTNTIFVVVADHGARVYGSQDIPIFSYEIPLVILGPAVASQPQRLHATGCSLDLPPTILGLIGRPYETLFLGRDLLRDPPDTFHALLNHNRDIGMFAQDRMVVLGLQKAVEFYVGNPHAVNLELTPHPAPEDLELEKDAEAIFQVADELYMNRRYHLDP